MSARSIRRSRERDEQRRGRRVARRAGLIAGAAAATAAIAAPNAQAANFPVSNLLNSGDDSLRNQIIAANANAGADTITFTGAATSGEIVLQAEIPITDDLTITGPGAGQLAISGDSDGDDVPDLATSPVEHGDTRIFDVSDPSSPGAPRQSVSISGLTLKEGVAETDAPAPAPGGAIYAQDTALDLTSVTLTGNVATDGGGAIYAQDSALALTRVTLTGNVATDGGGGAVLVGGPIGGRFEATDCTFTSNQARGGADGGAVLSELLQYEPVGTKISSSNFTGNRATGNGGAIVARGKIQIADATITGNTASYGAGGGALLVGDGAVQRTTIADNRAASLAGGVFLSGVDLRYSTVSGNTAGSMGGGVLAFPSFVGNVDPIRVDSSTISGNSTTLPIAPSGYGAGIAVYGISPYGAVKTTVLIARNSTIASNAASVNGGGILAIGLEDNPSAPLADLKSTIVADNEAAGSPNDVASVSGQGGFPVKIAGGFTASFSLVETPGKSVIADDPVGSNIIGVDPKLSPLASNGGPTQTMAIAASSAAVDSAQAYGFTTDQTGNPRTVDAVATNAPGADGTDIGAFELQDPNAVGGDPSTAFKKKPPKKVKLKGKKAKVKLQFSGKINSGAPGKLTFECKVDKGKFKACKSPMKVKLAEGKHTVEVRAIDSTGRVDSSPAKAKIKVKKAKPKKN